MSSPAEISRQPSKDLRNLLRLEDIMGSSEGSPQAAPSTATSNLGSPLSRNGNLRINSKCSIKSLPTEDVENSGASHSRLDDYRSFGYGYGYGWHPSTPLPESYLKDIDCDRGDEDSSRNGHFSGHSESGSPSAAAAAAAAAAAISSATSAAAAAAAGAGLGIGGGSRSFGRPSGRRRVPHAQKPGGQKSYSPLPLGQDHPSPSTAPSSSELSPASANHALCHAPGALRCCRAHPSLAESHALSREFRRGFASLGSQQPRPSELLAPVPSPIAEQDGLLREESADLHQLGFTLPAPPPSRPIPRPATGHPILFTGVGPATTVVPEVTPELRRGPEGTPVAKQLAAPRADAVSPQPGAVVGAASAGGGDGDAGAGGGRPAVGPAPPETVGSAQSENMDSFIAEERGHQLQHMHREQRQQQDGHHSMDYSSTLSFPSMPPDARGDAGNGVSCSSSSTSRTSSKGRDASESPERSPGMSGALPPVDVESTPNGQQPPLPEGAAPSQLRPPLSSGGTEGGGLRNHHLPATVRSTQHAMYSVGRHRSMGSRPSYGATSSINNSSCPDSSSSVGPSMARGLVDRLTSAQQESQEESSRTDREDPNSPKASQTDVSKRTSGPSAALNPRTASRVLPSGGGSLLLLPWAWKGGRHTPNSRSAVLAAATNANSSGSPRLAGLAVETSCSSSSLDASTEPAMQVAPPLEEGNPPPTASWRGLVETALLSILKAPGPFAFESLMQAFREWNLDEGGTIFQQGTPLSTGPVLCVLAQGVVDVMLTPAGSSEPEKVCTYDRPGQTFGDLEFLLQRDLGTRSTTRKLRWATYTARTDVTLWVTDREAFNRALARDVCNEQTNIAVEI